MGENQTTAGPIKATRSRDEALTSKKADLRQAVWEASQFMLEAEIEDFVAAVLHEIASDEGAVQ